MGEAKLYVSASEARQSALKSIEPLWDAEFLEEMKALIGPKVAAIVCTSSMIEGINTAAENVFIYDRKINTSKLDRFTFDNIKGRAGRMFKHNIGKVFLYNPPPEPEQFEVHVPLFNPDEMMRPELLMQLEDDILSDPVVPKTALFVA